MARNSGAATLWDFSKEEEGAGGKRFKEGDYLARVLKKVKAGTSEEKGTPYIEFTFKFLDGKYKGQTLSQRFYNSPKALWLMRAFIEACGKKVPTGKPSPRKIAALVVGHDVIITLTDNTNPNDNRTRSQVSDVINPDEFEDDEDIEEDEEEDDDLEIDDEDDDEEDEDEDEEDEPPARSRSKSKRSSSKSRGRRRKSSDDEEEDEDEEDDDLEELDLEGL